MKKSFLTLAAIALVLSFTSCKETTAESPEEVEVIETEAPVEEAPVETEVPAEVEVDSLSADGEVEGTIIETPSI